MVFLGAAGLIIVLAGYFLLLPKTPQASQPQGQTTTPQNSVQETKGASDTVVVGEITVTINEGFFRPEKVTIKKGTKVFFNNATQKPHQPASDDHPTHQKYPGFDPKKEIPPAESWSFTFNNVGTWGYHDHLTPTAKGTIVVTE